MYKEHTVEAKNLVLHSLKEIRIQINIVKMDKKLSKIIEELHYTCKTIIKIFLKEFRMA